MDDKLQSADCARFLKALADADRLKIVQCLKGGPKNVTEISELLGRELVNISHHLGVLRHAGIVQDQKRGKYVIYSLHPDVISKVPQAKDDCLDLGCCRLEWGKK